MEDEVVFDLPSDLIRRCSGLAVDFGGSLIKVIYRVIDHNKVPLINGRPEYRLCYRVWTPDQIDQMIGCLKDNCILSPGGATDAGSKVNSKKRRIATTGLQFLTMYRRFTSALHVTVNEMSEFECLVVAFKWIWKQPGKGRRYFYPLTDSQLEHIVELAATTTSGSNESGNENQSLDDVRRALSPPEDIYPVMLVQVGSGASFVRVEADGSFSIEMLELCYGGKTFIGLTALLTAQRSYEAIMTSVRRGSSSALDCSGREAPFKRAAPCKGNPEGNLARKPRDCHRTEDLAASLLRNQCSDLVELAVTYARAKGIRHVVFSGSYVEHDVTTALFQQLLAVKTLQSAEENRVYGFVLKDGRYATALGALIEQVENTKTN